MRERLVELIKQGDKAFADKYTGNVISHIDEIDEIYEFTADYLIANGVIVLPKADVVAYKKENTITPECITQALELLKSHAVIPDFRREVAFAHLLAEEKLKGEKG